MRVFIVSLSQKWKSLQVSSDRKSIPLPTLVVGLDPPIVPGPPGAWQLLTIICASPLQASIREATGRVEDVQGFQMFPVIEQRDTQGSLVRVHLPIPFKH